MQGEGEGDEDTSEGFEPEQWGGWRFVNKSATSRREVCSDRSPSTLQTGDNRLNTDLIQ